MTEIVLDGGSLSIHQLVEVADGARVTANEHARAKAERSRTVLREAISTGEEIYGVNTGFGPLRTVHVSEDEMLTLQENLLKSHAVGVGEPLDRRDVRASMALLAASHLRGASGVGPETALFICELLNKDDIPEIPSQGSLGASGDLAPLAHLGLALLERGLKLSAKAGLSLINGTHVHTGIGALLIAEAENLAKAADIACAMNLEAMLCSEQPFRADVHALRPHAHQIDSAANIAKLIRNSELIRSHSHCHEVQDAYSIRCAPQVHGAARQAIQHARDVIETELRSVTDNPLIVGKDVVSAGHFHGEPVGIALDYFKIGVSELGSIAERRTERALNKDYNRGLPPFLVMNAGLNSGMMICQYTAAALASENKVLCHPSCVDSITTGANQEDHVSMAMNAALHAKRVVKNTRNIIAIELLVAAQALDCRKQIQKESAGPGVLAAWAAVRKQSAHVEHDRSLSEDIELLDIAAIIAAVESEVGELE